MDELKDRIKKERLKKDLNQPQLAKVMNVSKQTVSNWENGNRMPDTLTLSKLADFFGCSVDYLLGRTNTLNEIDTKNSLETESCTIKFLKELIKHKAITNPENITIDQLNDLMKMIKKDTKELLKDDYK